MWYRMMAIACVANGLCAFGARVLEDLGLAKTHSFLYLAFWYIAGLAVSLLAFLRPNNEKKVSGTFSAKQPSGRSGKRYLNPFSRSELLIGGLMGVFSSVGWIFLTRAIAFGMPGYLAFPIAIGGNLSIVAAVGVLVFRERLSAYGYLGMLSGITGIALLVSV